ncbi:MAG: Ig-like domain-containing protein [Bacteroidales bacterium]|jgi:uncharacterized protein YjdB|nr:Ig-like domain-containing protein [Bacteroidales bacterium]
MKTFSMTTMMAGVMLCVTVLPACNSDESFTREDGVQNVEVGKLTASPVAVTVPVGGIRAIQAEITPQGANQMIYWKSADPEIAEVANGIIMGVAPGVTTVTVNSVEDASIKVEIAVTIVAAAIPVEEISFGATASPLTVYLGEGNVQLTPQILPADATNQEILWKNSASEIATVSESGLITPLQRGTTTITICAASDVGKIATLDVTVTLRNIPVESLSFAETEVPLLLNATYTANVTVMPPDATNRDVIWSSGNDAVATVIDGVITGVAVGNTTITATSQADPLKQAFITVTVNEDPDPFEVLVSAKGLWRFSDAANLGKSSIGPALTPVVDYGEITPLEGGKVRVGESSYFECTHGITPSPGSYVTTYTMLFDFSLPVIGPWCVFYQAQPGDCDEGEVYVDYYGSLGHGSYSLPVATDTWYRLVVVYDKNKDEDIHLYLDGAHFHSYIYVYNGSHETKELASTIRFLTDGWGGYDNELSISTIAIWDRVLSDAEIAALGGAE